MPTSKNRKRPELSNSIGYSASSISDWDQPDQSRESGFFYNSSYLARSAEWWGADGQSERLARIARHLAAGDIDRAASVRDMIKRDRDEAKFMRIVYGALLALIVASIGFAVHASLR